jgi:putative ABC transport system permease protein
MLRATFKGMLQRKLRLLLSGLAVVLGVMFVSGALILTDTLGRSFDQLFAGVHEHTDVRVRGEPKVEVSEFEGEQLPANIPADTVARVEQLDSVAGATGLVDADGAQLVGSDGKIVTTFGPPQLGINWTGEDELIQLRDGGEPDDPDEIAINAALAEEAGVSVGDRVEVQTPHQPLQEFTLVGTFGFSQDRDSLGGAQFIAFTDERAQELMLGELGVWSGVDVVAAEGVTPERLRDELAAALGDGYVVQTGAELADEQASRLKEGLSVINNILLGFAGVALFVGIFLILNTFSIVVAQRTRELALTRAVGASRWQIIGAVLLEAVVVGVLASALGLAAGFGSAAALASLAAGATSLPVSGMAVASSTVVAGLTVGILVTVLAAILPALRAARVPPVAAMQEAATPDRPLTRLTIAGTAVLAVGGAVLALGLSGNAGGQELWAVLAGVLACFVGVALLTPLVARPVVSVLGRLFAWSVPGKLGRLNSGRNPRRTAITAAALMVGVALVTGIGVVLDSAKTSFTRLATEVDAELVITGTQTGPRPPTFDGAVLAEAAELPGVAAVTGFYTDLAEVDGELTPVGAASDLPATSTIFGLSAVSGTLDPLAPGELVVDSRTAEERGITTGDQVNIQLSRGDARSYQVAAVYEWTPVLSGFALPQEAAADFAIPQPTMAFVRLADGTPANEVAAELTALLADSPAVSVADRTEFIEEQTSQLDGVFTIIQILLGLAILIAVLGIINTLALSVLERTRELGLVRAVGLGRGATMRMVTVEAVVIALFGALLGVVVGAGLGTATVRALADEGIDQLTLPWVDMATYLVLAGIVGIVAAVLPAGRAARTDILRAIAYE